MAKPQKFDVIIVGGGLAGLTLALYLGQQQRRVAVVERVPLITQQKRSFDIRTTALAARSTEILTDVGVWPDLQHRAAPIRTIEILDGPRLFGTWKPPLVFRHETPMGYIVDNQDLRQALAARVTNAENITVLAPTDVSSITPHDTHVTMTLQDGQPITAPLVVGADGRGSMVRETARIRTRGWPYPHTAVVCTLTHTGSHDDTAIEHFTRTGPFAVLPFTNDDAGNFRSALVWSDHPGTARQIMAMADDTFIKALRTRLPARYGDIVAVGPRAAYPLSLQHATDYIGDRLALVADAAHGIHPIAGQGLNLGLRDVQVLSGLIGDAHDPGAPEMLRSYQQARRMDVTAMVAATDILTDLFGSDIPGLPTARRLGLHAVAACQPLQRFFVKKAMGG